jgi:hypothetical protein
MTTIAIDDDVAPAGPGPYVELGDPDVAALVGDAAGTLQDLHWKLYRARLEELGPDWDARLAAVQDVVNGLRAGSLPAAHRDQQAITGS